MGSSHRIDGSHLQLEDSELAAYEAQKAKLNEEARENWGNAEWMAEAAAVITETIFWGFEHENVLQLMSNLQQNVGRFDRVTVKEVRGLRAFWLARGGYIRASQMWEDVAELQKAIVGFHVYEHTDKFEADYATAQGDLIDMGVQRMDAAVNQYVFALFQEAVPIGSANYHAVSGLDLETLDLALSQVFDLTQDGMVSIVGRRPMTDQINSRLLDLAGSQSVFLPETNERLMQLGVAGKYRGGNIVQIKNYTDDMDLPFLPANELWVVGRDASKSAFFGGLQAKEFEEDDDWYWHYLAKREFGMLVHRRDRLHRIVDSDILPGQGAGGSYVAA